jgi:hypothetical protein
MLAFKYDLSRSHKQAVYQHQRTDRTNEPAYEKRGLSEYDNGASDQDADDKRGQTIQSRSCLSI